MWAAKFEEVVVGGLWVDGGGEGDGGCDCWGVEVVWLEASFWVDAAFSLSPCDCCEFGLLLLGGIPITEGRGCSEVMADEVESSDRSVAEGSVADDVESSDEVGLSDCAGLEGWRGFAVFVFAFVNVIVVDSEDKALASTERASSGAVVGAGLSAVVDLIVDLIGS